MVDDDPAEEDDDFEVDLEVVDVLSFGSPDVFMGFETLLFESIPVLTTSLNDQLNYHRSLTCNLFIRAFVLCGASFPKTDTTNPLSHFMLRENLNLLVRL